MRKIWLVVPFLFIVPVLTHAQLDSLKTAAATGDTSDLRILIAAGADVNATDGDGSTALMFAAIAGHTEAVQILIAAGADVNATTGSDGTTALRLAAIAGHAQVVQTLIAAGADVNAKTNDGRTALSLAEGEGHSDVSRMLVVAGAEDTDSQEVSQFPSDEAIAGTVVVDELMWTIRDNGADVDWNEATQYCADLTLGGYTDWRLGTIDEVESLYDANESYELTSDGVFDLHIRDPFRLSGIWVWTSTGEDSRAYLFNFTSTLRYLTAVSDSYRVRALCVGGSGE